MPLLFDVALGLLVERFPFPRPLAELWRGRDWDRPVRVLLPLWLLRLPVLLKFRGCLLMALMSFGTVASFSSNAVVKDDDELGAERVGGIEAV